MIDATLILSLAMGLALGLATGSVGRWTQARNHVETGKERDSGTRRR